METFETKVVFIYLKSALEARRKTPMWTMPLKQNCSTVLRENLHYTDLTDCRKDSFVDFQLGVQGFSSQMGHSVYFSSHRDLKNLSKYIEWYTYCIIKIIEKWLIWADKLSFSKAHLRKLSRPFKLSSLLDLDGFKHYLLGVFLSNLKRCLHKWDHSKCFGKFHQSLWGKTLFYYAFICST